MFSCFISFFLFRCSFFFPSFFFIFFFSLFLIALSLFFSLSLFRFSSFLNTKRTQQKQQKTNKQKNSKGKPHPEIFQLAASRFASPPASPSDVLVFEDAPIGVEAALAAGMRCVFVPDERTPKSDAHDKACLVLKSLEEFDPVAWGLPPFP